MMVSAGIWLLGGWLIDSFLVLPLLPCPLQAVACSLLYWARLLLYWASLLHLLDRLPPVSPLMIMAVQAKKQTCGAVGSCCTSCSSM